MKQNVTPPVFLYHCANAIPAPSGSWPPTIPWPPLLPTSAWKRCIEPPLPLEQPVAVAAVAIDEVIPGGIEDGGGTDGNRLLAAVKMAEATDLLAGAGVLLIG